MHTLHRAFVLAGVVAIAGCTDQIAPPTAPPHPDVALPVAIGSSQSGVAAFGSVEAIDLAARRLVLLQKGFEFTPAAGARVESARYDVAIGAVDEQLPVQLPEGVRVFLNGEEKSLADLAVGMPVIVGGRAVDGILEARIIGDLTSAAPPSEKLRQMIEQHPKAPEPDLRISAVMPAFAGQLCEGQDFDYDDPNILDFQGCWGGPSASDSWDTNVILPVCPVLGCFVIDRVSYVAALSGGKFGFPFEFKATADPGLIYHAPGSVSLQVVPKPATEGEDTFNGGTGVNLAVNFDFCWIVGGCDNVGTVDLNVFSMIFRSGGAAPLTGELEISEPACPGIGVLSLVWKVSFDPLSVSLCQDNDLVGKPFHSIVSLVNGWVPAQMHEFTGGAIPTSVRPNAMEVEARFDDLEWRPELRIGMYFRLEMFSIDVWSSPHIPFGDIPFPAITNPFPTDGMSLAGDPHSGGPLEQPTLATITLPVAKAPTTVSILSGSFLAEDTPVRVRLLEAITGWAIPGAPITVQANGLNGTPSVTRTVTTAGGIATFTLPVGEYALTLQYAGSDTYLPSEAEMAPVYVYRPTTFVIWGGNAGGLSVGEPYQFWGQGWIDQVTGGAFGGNASFQGFAIPLSATRWASPPAASGDGPATLPDLIAVIVTTEVTGRGANSTGNIAGWALLRVSDPATYQPNGGHRATGVMRALLP